uniref:Transposase n=1 Tax=Strongyloides venezuelensis TaxID=75913 RepID=A0A0K0FRK8_STRVS
MDSLIIFDHAKQIAENTEKEINLFFKENYLNNKQIEGVNRMIMNIFKTSQVPVLTHALTFIKFMTVKSEGEDLEEIDLPLALVSPFRLKIKDE